MKHLWLLLLISTASAQVTYDYTSGAITSVVTGGSEFGGFNAPAVGTDVTGVITLASELPANGTTYVTPLTYSFNVPVNGYAPGAAAASFSFTTVNGNVTAFSFSDYTAPQTITEQLVSSSATGMTYSQRTPTGGYTVTASAGGWTDPPATFAVTTTESHTGGGGALELALLLSVMAIRRTGRHA